MDPAELSDVEQDAKRAARTLRELGPRVTPLRVAKVLTWPEARALEALRCLVDHRFAVRIGSQRFTLTPDGYSRAADWEAGRP